MLVNTAPQTDGARLLRRILPFALAGLVAAALIAGYSVAFAQEATELEMLEAKLNRQNDNLVLMLGAFLVFFMQAGFAFLGAGLIRAKNTTNYMTKSFMDFAITSLSFWAFGFAIMFGTSEFGVIGNTNYFLSDGIANGNYVNFLFQMVFAATAATIVAGAVAERTKTQAYLAYSFIIGAIIYPLYGHWAWNEAGWLGALDKIDLPAAADYAGSGVVHAVGGFIALAGAVVVGPRLGKFNADGTSNILSGHNVPFVVIGTFILFFGWFGFNINSGSIGLNATNTLMAGATGSVVALYIQLVRTGKTDILIACNGALAGLVGITAGAAYVEPWGAVAIGAIAAPIMMSSVIMIERVFKIDDPVGAISVHGVTGLWGLLAVGIFASGQGGVEGLVEGEGKQILSQLITMGVVMAWGLVTGFALFLFLKATMGVRATEEEELEGLDISEHSLPAYGDD